MLGKKQRAKFVLLFYLQVFLCLFEPQHELAVKQFYFMKAVPGILIGCVGCDRSSEKSPITISIILFIAISSQIIFPLNDFQNIMPVNASPECP
jgi:hypothetical protein